MKYGEIYEVDLSHITKKDLRKAHYKTLNEAMFEYNDFVYDRGGETEITFEQFLHGEYDEEVL